MKSLIFLGPPPDEWFADNTPRGDWCIGGTWTPVDVETETQAGYFPGQWQGDNERLNAHLAHWRQIRLQHDAWKAGLTPYPRYTSSLLLYEAPE